MDKANYKQVKQKLAEYLNLTDAQQLTFIKKLSNEDPELAAQLNVILEIDTQTKNSILDMEFIHCDFSRAEENIFSQSEDINKYRIEKQIGRGGISEVYQAVQKFPVPRKVAIKVLKRDPYQNLLANETEKLAQLNHAHIATIYEVNQTQNGQLYVVMELINGPDIITYCESQNLNTKQRLKLFLQLCQGISSAHERGIIHCDIKPSNVLTMISKDTVNVKIIDFGISQLQSSSISVDKIAGTPAYLSPESKQSNFIIDTRHDVYAMGVLLHRLLLGCMPSQSHSNTAIVNDLLLIIKKCLSKHVQRYNSVQALIQDIENYYKHKEVTAHQASFFYSTGLFLKRRYGAVLFSIGILTAISGGYYAQSIQAKAALQAQLNAEKTTDFLVNLFEIANPEKTKSAIITAQALIDKARDDLLKIEQPNLSEAKFMHTIGSIYTRMDNMPQARDILIKSLDAKRGLLVKNDSEIITTLIQLGAVYRSRKLQENELAKDSLEQAVLLLNSQAKVDESLLAYTYNHLGNLYWRMTQFKKAIEHHKQALTLRQKNQEFKQVADSLNNLGVSYRSQENWDESLKYFEAAEKLYIQEYGNDHAFVLYVKNNMAYLVEKRFYDFDKAESLLNESYQGFKNKYGENHFNSITTASNLAKFHTSRMNYPQAIEYWKKAIKSYQETNNVEWQAKRMGLLSQAYYADGQIEKGRQTHIQALELLATVQAKDPKAKAVLLSQYGQSLFKQGDYNQAIEQLQDSLAELQSQEISSAYYAVKNLLAMSHLQLGHIEIAENSYSQTLDDFTQDETSKNSVYYQIQNIKTHIGLGQVYLQKQLYAQGITQLNIAIQIADNELGTENTSTAKAKFIIGQHYYQQKQYQKAKTWLQQALTTQLLLLPAKHPDLLATQQQLNSIAS